MRVLLDSHTFIWWDDNNISRLSPTALAVCQDKTNTLLISAASIWEMQIKVQLGKMHFVTPLPETIVNQQRINKMQILPIRLNHIYTLEKLPHHHKDPFDRLLIAQAVHENIPIVSHDSEIAKYSLKVIW